MNIKDLFNKKLKKFESSYRISRHEFEEIGESKAINHIKKVLIHDIAESLLKNNCITFLRTRYFDQIEVKAVLEFLDSEDFYKIKSQLNYLTNFGKLDKFIARPDNNRKQKDTIKGALVKKEYESEDKIR